MTANDEVVDSIGALVALFLPLCSDSATLSELQGMVMTQDEWHKAHNLFGRIRLKNLAAAKAGDLPREAQYCFEEACAKTLYNLTQSAAPFDQGSPEWIGPNAMSLSRHLGLPDAEVTARLGPNNSSKPMPLRGTA